MNFQNIPNIPTPNFSRHNLETQRAATELIMDLIANSPTIPEHLKIGVKIMNAYAAFDNCLVSAAKHFSEPAKSREENESLLPERQEFLEYLQLMKAGLDSFLTAHPIAPPDSSAETGFKAP